MNECCGGNWKRLEDLGGSGIRERRFERDGNGIVQSMGCLFNIKRLTVGGALIASQFSSSVYVVYKDLALMSLLPQFHLSYSRYWNCQYTSKYGIYFSVVQQLKPC